MLRIEFSLVMVHRGQAKNVLLNKISKLSLHFLKISLVVKRPQATCLKRDRGQWRKILITTRTISLIRYLIPCWEHPYFNFKECSKFESNNTSDWPTVFVTSPTDVTSDWLSQSEVTSVGDVTNAVSIDTLGPLRKIEVNAYFITLYRSLQEI